MDHARADEDLIRVTLEMVAANEAYQAALVMNAALLRGLAERLGRGEDVVDIVRATPGKPGRSGDKSAEDVLESARSRFRVALVASCMAGGMSRKEIANNMGYSRQLVERYVRAATGQQ